MVSQKRKINNITSFGLLRHARTVWNDQKKLQGTGDSPLTEKGRLEAERWAKALETCGFQRIIVSPLGRALETADILNRKLKLPVFEDEKLAEQHWGLFEGMTIRQIRENEPELLGDMEKMGWDFRPPDGEARKEVLERALTALEDASGKWPSRKILIITHQGVLKCLVYHLMKRDFMPFEKKVDLGRKLHRIDCRRKRMKLESPLDIFPGEIIKKTEY